MNVRHVIYATTTNIVGQSVHIIRWKSGMTLRIVGDMTSSTAISAKPTLTMIIEKNANLLEEPLDGIIHQANCLHIMGGGIALRIKNKWPAAFEADLLTKKADPKKLGTFSVAVLPSNFHIYNMYSQFAIGEGRNTDYTAVVNGLEAIRRHAEENGLLQLGCPKYMGCRLGGGYWPVVRAILDEVFEHADVDLVICNYDG